MKKLIHRFFLLLIFSFMTACQSNKQEQIVTWGYTTGDPILDAGYEGNFYPQVVHEGEGAVSH